MGGESNVFLHEILQEALEMLLSGGPQKSESHPLANYHYTGKLEVELVPSAGMLIDTAVAFLYADLRNLF